MKRVAIEAGVFIALAVLCFALVVSLGEAIQMVWGWV